MIRTKEKAPVKSRGQTSGVKPLKRAVTSAAKTEVSRRGRPPSGKIMVNLRLDPDIVTRFKATGKGWQARINEALRKA